MREEAIKIKSLKFNLKGLFAYVHMIVLKCFISIDCFFFTHFISNEMEPKISNCSPLPELKIKI